MEDGGRIKIKERDKYYSWKFDYNIRDNYNDLDDGGGVPMTTVKLVATMIATGFYILLLTWVYIIVR